MLQFVTRRLALAASFVFAASTALAQSAPPILVGTWRGSYVCLQGKTRLTLIIDSQSNDGFNGYFHFHPPKSNPVAREGCFGVSGRIDPAGRVTIDAGQWIARPEGYVTVNLDGRLAGNGRSMSGDVHGPRGVETRCQQFRVDRRSPRPDVPGLCRGTVALLTEARNAAP